MKIWRHLNLKENISRPILLTNGWLGIGLGGGCGGAFGIVKLANQSRGWWWLQQNCKIVLAKNIWNFHFSIIANGWGGHTSNPPELWGIIKNCLNLESALNIAQLTIQVIKKEKRKKGGKREHLRLRKQKTVLRGESGTLQQVNRCCRRQGGCHRAMLWYRGVSPSRVLPPSPIQHLHCCWCDAYMQYCSALWDQLTAVQITVNQWKHFTVAVHCIQFPVLYSVECITGKGFYIWSLSHRLAAGAGAGAVSTSTLWRFQIVTGALHHFSDRSQHRHHYCHHHRVPWVVCLQFAFLLGATCASCCG